MLTSGHESAPFRQEFTLRDGFEARRAMRPQDEMVDFAPARLTSMVSLSTISRTVYLSFQSSFHLFLTVLVRYRSLANI